MATFNTAALQGKWTVIKSDVRPVVVPVEILAIVGFDESTDDILALVPNIDGAREEAKASAIYKLDLTSTLFFDNEADAHAAALAENTRNAADNGDDDDDEDDDDENDDAGIEVAA